ncbi:hypothetical protein LT337_12770 [Mycolicibacterium fortuitum]|nr:hypothetical protein LT337_12770 [Mycolicibacterium fortuitum]
MDTATNAAKDAIGQAMDAAKNAAGQNPLGDMPKGPPEGVLGLGPQGLGGAGAAKGGGGAGGGVPLRGLPSSLPTGAPATAAAKMPAAATGAGAGLGAGAGSPGAGAPAAGQRAGDQNGKGHQVNKALRRKKNGKDVIGGADASVPVVGADDEAAHTETAPSDASEPRRRIPQRGNTWQPDSAVQPAPVRPARGSQFTPGRPSEASGFVLLFQSVGGEVEAVGVVVEQIGLGGDRPVDPIPLRLVAFAAVGELSADLVMPPGFTLTAEHLHQRRLHGFHVVADIGEVLRGITKFTRVTPNGTVIAHSSRWESRRVRRRSAARARGSPADP